MLAEKRTKQDWTITPRGSPWSLDNNTFGRRLLEKMGWKKGCGLGTNLQGCQEPIRVPFKGNLKGFGFNRRAEDVLEHQDNYSKLLEELNGGVKPDVEVNSLELQSQKSRARVHYHKFTRGKDLSRRSNKDLQCILGKSTGDKKKVKRVQHLDEPETEVKSFGVVTLNGGNSYDYFRKKSSNSVKHKSENKFTETDFGDGSILKPTETESKNNKYKNSDSIFKPEEMESSLGDLTVLESCTAESEPTKNNFNGPESEIRQKEKHILDRRKNKKRKSLEDCEDKLQKVKVKKKKEQAFELGVTEVNETSGLELDSKISDISSYKKKSKKKRKHKDKNLDHCEKELQVGEDLAERVTTGIIKGSPLTDCGFKGANIMCIKGYGIF